MNPSEGGAEARGAQAEPLSNPPLMYDISQYYNNFLNKKCDFITIKCNRGVNYQNIDQVRKLLCKHYKSIVLVGSPKTGQHWHAICSDPPITPMKVKKSVHLNRHRIGTLNYSSANRRSGNPYGDDPTLLTCISHLPRRAPVVSSPGMSYKEQLSACLCYLFTNLLENPTYSRFDNLYVRLC